jgi:hypothetical protein
MWPFTLALRFVLGKLFNVAHIGQDLLGQTIQVQSAQAAPRPDGGGQAVLGRSVAPR